jgi:hypothetical protein
VCQSEERLCQSEEKSGAQALSGISMNGAPGVPLRVAPQTFNSSGKRVPRGAKSLGKVRAFLERLKRRLHGSWHVSLGVGIAAGLWFVANLHKKPRAGARGFANTANGFGLIQLQNNSSAFHWIDRWGLIRLRNEKARFHCILCGAICRKPT